MLHKHTISTLLHETTKYKVNVMNRKVYAKTLTQANNIITKTFTPIRPALQIHIHKASK